MLIKEENSTVYILKYLITAALQSLACIAIAQVRQAQPAIVCSLLRAMAMPVLLLGLVSGCGFQLQKPLVLNESWQPIFIDASGELRRALQRELLENNLSITRNRKNAGSTLALSAKPIETRSLSISFDGRDAEILRSLDTEMEWRDANGRLLANTGLSAEQSQLASPAQRAAQQREADALDQLLRADIAKQALAILRHPVIEHASLP
ncbi:MAG: hypothetical protein KJO62_01430 [Gammaproteobacteria bacterium]|nr:hypothetical protein [Gammaproteobacteria bacterium]